MATHRYRSRDISGEEILFIRQLIRDHPELSRWKLSRQLCEAWQWKQANGALRDMVCRGLLLMLDRAGEIELPPVKRVVRNRIAERERSQPVIPDNRPVRGPLSSITPLAFVQVRRTPEEPLFNAARSRCWRGSQPSSRTGRLRAGRGTRSPPPGTVRTMPVT
jgi:hypothetical protein